MNDAYLKAGVDTEAGEEIVKKISKHAKRTNRKEVLSQLGGFSSLFSVPKGYVDPVLVSGTDGVGTKLLLAQKFNQHKTIGVDLVAMCVNDVVTSGAEPLFFLDYFATGKLDTSVAVDVIAGISEGCRLAGCSLVGGETAEMPGMYADGHYDLAGFCVGIVERSQVIDGSKIREGDIIVGLPSSGLHSNGFSLARKALEGMEEFFIEELMEPTKIYVDECLSLIKKYEVHGMAHITGGGFDNIGRLLPEGLGAVINKNSWPTHKIFETISVLAEMSEEEKYKVFNCGIGMVVILPEGEVKHSFGHTIGKIIKGEGVRLV